MAGVTKDLTLVAPKRRLPGYTTKSKDYHGIEHCGIGARYGKMSCWE
ncbi:MAG: hypothetical protein ACI9ON_001551 [Limisphaerales bacterium]|jgi:hypothetical protein